MNEAITKALATIPKQKEDVERMVAQATVAKEGALTLMDLNLRAKTSAERTSLSTAEGLQVAQRADREVEAVAERLAGIDAKQRTIARISSETQGLVGALEDISGRAHVISINAAIESSRNQEATAAFGVLSKEFQKLSEQSRKLTQHAQGLLGHLDQEVQALSQDVQEGTQLAAKGREAMRQARQAFEAIAASVADLVALNQAGNDQAEAVSQVGQRLPELAALVAQNRAVIAAGLAAAEAAATQ
jgi:methyl-accepting chemotaxis protein